MPTFFVTLAFSNVDIDDDSVIEDLAEKTPWIQWLEVDGEVRAMITRNATSPIALAVEAITAVRSCVSSATAARVVEDFVTISDVAKRVGVNRETVRTWVKGSRGPGNFPRPRDTVGVGMQVWDWSSVNNWLGDNYALGDGRRHLSQAEVADVERAIESITRPSKPWCTEVVHVDWQSAKRRGSSEVQTGVTSHPVSKTAAR